MNHFTTTKKRKNSLTKNVDFSEKRTQEERLIV